jgi:tetratricopeptide (TPR) repeat protein
MIGGLFVGLTLFVPVSATLAQTNYASPGKFESANSVAAVRRDCEQTDYAVLSIRACTAWLSSHTLDQGSRLSGLTNRGQAWLREGEPETAAQDFASALELDAVHTPALLGRARAFEMLGRYDAAIDDWTELISAQPSAVEPYLGRANARAANADHAGAISDFTKVVALDEKRYVSFLGRAASHMALGDTKAALADLDKVIATDSDFIPAYVARAELWEQLDEPARAISDYQDALKRNAFNLKVRRALQRLGIYHPYP